MSLLNFSQILMECFILLLSSDFVEADLMTVLWTAVHFQVLSCLIGRRKVLAFLVWTGMFRLIMKRRARFQRRWDFVRYIFCTFWEVKIFRSLEEIREVDANLEGERTRSNSPVSAEADTECDSRPDSTCPPSTSHGHRKWVHFILIMWFMFHLSVISISTWYDFWVDFYNLFDRFVVLKVLPIIFFPHFIGEFLFH